MDLFPQWILCLRFDVTFLLIVVNYVIDIHPIYKNGKPNNIPSHIMVSTDSSARNGLRFIFEPKFVAFGNASDFNHV